MFLDFPRRKPSPIAEKISVRSCNSSVIVMFIWNTPFLHGTGGNKFHPLMGGIAAYRYWQNPVPGGTDNILPDGSGIVKYFHDKHAI